MVFKGAFAKLQRATNPLASVMSDCPSVRPHGTTRHLLDGFSQNLIFEYS